MWRSDAIVSESITLCKIRCVEPHRSKLTSAESALVKVVFSCHRWVLCCSMNLLSLNTTGHLWMRLTSNGCHTWPSEAKASDLAELKDNADRMQLASLKGASASRYRFRRPTEGWLWKWKGGHPPDWLNAWGPFIAVTLVLQ